MTFFSRDFVHNLTHRSLVCIVAVSYSSDWPVSASNRKVPMRWPPIVTFLSISSAVSCHVLFLTHPKASSERRCQSASFKGSSPRCSVSCSLLMGELGSLHRDIGNDSLVPLMKCQAPQQFRWE